MSAIPDQLSAYRVRKLLSTAAPDGTPCTVPGCPFPALVRHRCRQHILDEFTESSPTGSSLLPAILELVN